jgi:hypothetical protein
VRHFFHFHSANIEDYYLLPLELRPRVGWQIAIGRKASQQR